MACRSHILLLAGATLVASGCLEFTDVSYLDGHCFDDDRGRYVLCADAETNSGPGRDAGVPTDAAPDDLGPPDTGPADLGARDAEPGDLSAPDADAGQLDAVVVDLGGPDAGWVDITLSPTGPGQLVAPDHGQACNSECTFAVPASSVVRVQAVADTGAELDTWTQPASCLAAGAECDVLAATPLTVGAAFVLSQRLLTVQISAGSSGMGTVLGPSGISCPTTCSSTFEHGAAVQLEARPGPGTRFVRWLGDCTGSNLTCDIAMDTARTAVVEFEAVPPLVTDGQAADQVLGQLTFTATTPRPVSAGSLESPVDCDSDGTSLWVSDDGSHRVLYWLSMPTLNGQAADLVLGQSAPDTQVRRPTDIDTLREPGGVSAHAGKLFVADENRLVIWDTLPTFSGTPPGRFLGQTDWNAASLSIPTTAHRFLPQGVAVRGGRLFVVDSLANRVLVWNTVPSGSGLAPADLALGQATMTASQWTVPPTASSMRLPEDVAFDDATGHVAVADYSNNRVLIWTQPPTQTNQPADIILGQTSATGDSINAGLPSLNAVGMNGPIGVLFTADSLLVADLGNRRVMVWTPVPTTTGAPATAVLGAPNLSAQGPASPGTGAFRPYALCQSGRRLFVVDSATHRVLRFTMTRP